MPEDSPKLQVLLPFLWWGTFNIWSAIQKGKKDTFQSKYTHSKQNKHKKHIYKKYPEVIGYNWNHKSAQQNHKGVQLIVNFRPIMGQRGGVGGVVEGWQTEMEAATPFLI